MLHKYLLFNSSNYIKFTVKTSDNRVFPKLHKINNVGKKYIHTGDSKNISVKRKPLLKFEPGTLAVPKKWVEYSSLVISTNALD